jgi:hypothetical protein
MVISVTQSSKKVFADWLGVIGTTSRSGTCFSQNQSNFQKIRATPRLKQQKKVGR